jgi:hypothetical protein
MLISTKAGNPVKPEILVNVPKLFMAYFAEVPDASVTEPLSIFSSYATNE